MTTRFVSVPNPEPASATSLATSRSMPLRRSLSAARSSDPVSAANPTSTGRGARSAATRATPASRSGVGSSWRVSDPPRSSLRSALVAGRKSATAAAITRASKPALTPSIVMTRRSAASRSAVELTWTTSSGDIVGQDDFQMRCEEGDHRTAIERGGDDRRPHLPGRAVADEADRVDGLAGPAGGHDDVPAGEVGVVRWLDERRARRRIRGTERAPGRRPRPPPRRCPRARPVARRPTGRRPAVPPRAPRSCSRSRRAAARCSPASPDASTCRHPSPGPRRPAPSSRGTSRSRRRLTARWPWPRGSGRSQAPPR